MEVSFYYLPFHPGTITGIEADEDNTLYICTCRGGWFQPQLVRYVTAGQRVEGTAAASAWAVPCASPPVSRKRDREREREEKREKQEERKNERESCDRGEERRGEERGAVR
jgi:hypothetical protein